MKSFFLGLLLALASTSAMAGEYDYMNGMKLNELFAETYNAGKQCYAAVNRKVTNDEEDAMASALMDEYCSKHHAGMWYIKTYHRTEMLMALQQEEIHNTFRAMVALYDAVKSTALNPKYAERLPKVNEAIKEMEANEAATRELEEEAI